MRSLTPLQRDRLFGDIWDALNPVRDCLHCSLCSWLVAPRCRGRNRAHTHATYGTLCGRCWKLPDDTWQAAELLAEWADLDYLAGRRTSVDELCRRIRGWTQRLVH
jgi:hypothetical protein